MEDRSNSDASATVTNVMPHMPHRGFPHLLALWGDTPLPPPPPHPYLCTPSSPPWVGPVVDATNERGAQIAQWKREGRSLPAHIYSKDSPPPDSPWWSAPIQRLFGEAKADERRVRLTFVFTYHVLHPDRKSRPPAFLHQHSLLLARLGTYSSLVALSAISLTIFNQAACAHAIFFLRTRLQEGVTAATAARAGAIVGARREQAATGACAAAVYSKCEICFLALI
jgi:hypothetical protein